MSWVLFSFPAKIEDRSSERKEEIEIAAAGRGTKKLLPPSGQERIIAWDRFCLWKYRVD
jgi:hypothetical protein